MALIITKANKTNRNQRQTTQEIETRAERNEAMKDGKKEK